MHGRQQKRGDTLHAHHQTPAGVLRITVSAHAVHAIRMADTASLSGMHDGDIEKTNDHAYAGAHPKAISLMDATRYSLDAYFDGKLTRWVLPLDMQGTIFQRKAWQVLRNIPFGQVITYKEQASCMGCTHACRAVGRANACNPLWIALPCHRVIRTDGEIGGYAGGVDIKRKLLAHERRFR